MNKPKITALLLTTVLLLSSCSTVTVESTAETEQETSAETIAETEAETEAVAATETANIPDPVSTDYTGMTAEEIVAALTLEQKAAQRNMISYEKATEVLFNNRRVLELVYQKDAALLRSIPNGAFLIARIDDHPYFGQYPQNQGAAPEPIAWKVLRRESDRILLISKYVLDCKPYNTTQTDVTWETCSLRKWLNHEFLYAAFTAEERKRIPTGSFAKSMPLTMMFSAKSPGCSSL